MQTVDIRELENRLREYLRWVEAGEIVLVTDHGRAVAELRPPNASELDTLERLAREGRVRIGLPNEPDLYLVRSATLAHSSIVELLNAERGDR